MKYLEILENEFLPRVQEHYGQQPVRFIQDRSFIHTARVVTQWFREHPQIQLLPWPSKGADINRIENVWGDIVKDFDCRHAQNSDDVFYHASNHWLGYNKRPQYWLDA